MDMSKYKGMFISETKEHLQTMNQLIIALEKEPSGQENIEALFREAHSIKGMSASMGYSDISELSHKMEDMMDLFRKGTAVLDSDAVDILFECLDALELMVKGIEADKPAGLDCSGLIERMHTFREGGGKRAPAEPVPPAPPPAEAAETFPAGDDAEAAGGAEFLIEVKIDGTSQIPGMRGFLIYKNLSAVGTVTRVEPPLEEIKKGNFKNEIAFHFITSQTGSDIEHLLKKMVDIAGFNIQQASILPAGAESPAAAGEAGGDKKAAPPSTGKSASVRTVRVTTDLLDNLINIVGEMIIARSRLFESGKSVPAGPLQEAMVQMSGLIRDLHNQVLSVRMTPIENLMERLPRVVRDLARKGGKRVELQIEGKDIELDRAIVEELGDPFVHILRNCVDHGIETVEERSRAGKNPTGRIRIRAMREKDQVYINIEDDGRGMDPEKIKRKAIARGLIKKERAQFVSEKDLFMLVCHSGLSTADKITEVSGRGVGMDAVKTVVDSIGGSLDIDSQRGKGTTITLKLPLTVAIVHVLLVRIDREVLAIPISKIIRTLEVPRKELKHSQKQLAVLVEGEMIPLLSLKRILRMKGKEKTAQQISIVIIEIRGKKAGLVVDGFVAQQEAFVKPLVPPLEWVRGVSGATILGDGSVVFVLDIPNLL